jgi:hypothetical protein
MRSFLRARACPQNTRPADAVNRRTPSLRAAFALTLVLTWTSGSSQFPKYKPDEQAEKQPAHEAYRKDLLLRHGPWRDRQTTFSHHRLRSIEDLPSGASSRKVSANDSVTMSDPPNSAASSTTRSAASHYFPCSCDGFGGRST